ncbi:hypothetical protein D3C75_901390 [compost metagenome]
MLHADIINQEAHGKIIAAVQHQIHAGQQFFRIGRVQIGHMGLDGDQAVDSAQPFGGCRSLGPGAVRIGLLIEHLPLQIALLHKIPVDQADIPHAGPDHVVGQHGSQSAHADDSHTGFHKLQLAGFAQRPEKHLPGIAGRHLPGGNRLFGCAHRGSSSPPSGRTRGFHLPPEWLWGWAWGWLHWPASFFQMGTICFKRSMA